MVHALGNAGGREVPADVHEHEGDRKRTDRGLVEEPREKNEHRERKQLVARRLAHRPEDRPKRLPLQLVIEARNGELGYPFGAFRHRAACKTP